MKKKLIYLISAFVLAASLCACSEGEGVAADTADLAEEVTVNTVKDTADDTEDAESDAAGSAYADIYISEIEKLSSSGEADLFALVYVDDDEIPELAAVSYNVNLDDGYMKLIDAESTPYYSYDEIIGILKK